MDLKDFIKTALVDLITAVDEAKTEFNKIAESNGSRVCPPIAPAYSKEFKTKVDAHGRYHENVEFDIAVSAAT